MYKSSPLDSRPASVDIAAHEAAHPAPTDRDVRNEVAGSTATHAAITDTVHGLDDKADKLSTEIIVNTSGAVTVAQCSGTLINNYGQSADVDLTLPAAAEGLNFIVSLGTTVANRLRFIPATGEIIALDGATTGANKYVQIASAVKYNTIQFFTIQTGATTFEWQAVSVLGLWAQEA